MSNNKTVQELYDYLAVRFEFNAAEWENRRHINLGQLGTYKSLLQCHNLLQEGNETLALVELNDFISYEEGKLRKFSVAEVTEEALAYFAEGVRVAEQIKADYARFKEQEYAPLLEQFHTPDLYAPEEINPQTVAPEHFLNLRQIQDLGYFKGRLRSAVDESEPIEEDLFNYQLASNIVITDSFTRYLGNLNLSETTKVAMFFVLEDPIPYSYFAFVIQYKGYVWLYSDAIDYVNPVTKSSSRNPYRKVEDKLSQVWLPYRIIDEVEQWRKTANVAEQGKERSEFYSKEIKEYFGTIEKLYVQTLIRMFLQDIRLKKPMQKAVTVGEFINSNRLLSTGELTMDPMPQYEEAKMEGWFKESQERYQDLLEGLGMRQELVKVNPEKFLDRMSTWVTTPEKFQSLLVWSALEDERQVVRDKMMERYGEFGWMGSGKNQKYKRDKDKLQKMLVAALPSILEKLAITNEMTWIKGPNVSFGRRDKKPHEWDCLDVKNEKPGPYHDWPHLWVGAHNRKEYDYCTICRTHKNSFRLRFTAHHYRVLMWLLEIGRFDLPPLYRNFNTHDIYTGNSILDNVHPLARLEDPLSDRELPNGMRLDFFCCKTCWNKARKANYVAEKLSLNTIIEEYEIGKEQPK